MLKKAHPFFCKSAQIELSMSHHLISDASYQLRGDAEERWSSWCRYMWWLCAISLARPRAAQKWEC